MLVKKCRVCKQDKEIIMFYKDKTRKDGYGLRCKECDKEYQKTSNRKIYRYKYNKIIGQKKIEIYHSLKNQLKCSLCQESDDCCLDFHHINKKHEYIHNHKTNMLSFILKYSYKQICDELNKCICVCSNCHRKIHGNIITLSEKDIEKLRLNYTENDFPPLLNGVGDSI